MVGFSFCFLMCLQKFFKTLITRVGGVGVGVGEGRKKIEAEIVLLTV